MKKFLIAYVSPIISAILLLTILQFIDTRYFAPATLFTPSTVRIGDGYVLVSGSIYKPEYRASCVLDTLVAVPDSYEPQVLFAKGGPGVYTRPWGLSNFKDWKITGTNIHKIEFTSRHSCYGSYLWEHSTNLGTVVIDPTAR